MKSLALSLSKISPDFHSFLDLDLYITIGIVSTKIYDKRDDFNFEIVNFPFLDGDVPHSPSYGVFILQLIRFARVCSLKRIVGKSNFSDQFKKIIKRYKRVGYNMHIVRQSACLDGPNVKL